MRGTIIATLILMMLEWVFNHPLIVLAFSIYGHYIKEPLYEYTDDIMTGEHIEQMISVKNVSRIIPNYDAYRLEIFGDVLNTHPTANPEFLYMACQATDHVVSNDERPRDVGVRDYIVSMHLQSDFRLILHGTTRVAFDARMIPSIAPFDVEGHVGYSYHANPDENTIFSNCATAHTIALAVAKVAWMVGPEITKGRWRYKTDYGRALRYY